MIVHYYLCIYKMKDKYRYPLFISIAFGVIILILLYIIFYPSSIIDIDFLTKEETQQFMERDEDGYIRNLSIYDLRARNVDTNDNYLKVAINSCLEFNETQKHKLRVCALEALKYFNNNQSWTFALVSNSYEEGFPHTRANIIFLSPLILNYSNTELVKTLIHESTHIYQRYNKEAIDSYLYKNGYSISRLKDSKVRANPDLDTYIYKNKDGKELVAYYKSDSPKGIGDVVIIEGEHPFEVMAYEYAEAYSKKLMMKYKRI
jgi:hypothetical protein